MTQIKKRYVCGPIIESPLASELFRLFESYVKYDNKDVLDYVIMVIEIFQNCSEVSNLSDNILSIDVVS